jgi:hypothetical protein
MYGWQVPLAVVEGQPEVTWERMRPEDEFLIVGCDGDYCDTISCHVISYIVTLY